MARRGNPTWVKGKSGNPYGRPRGQNSYAVFCRDPEWFLIKHSRWQTFCCLMFLTGRPMNQAEAARRAGYSAKSARFIACRLIKKPMVRATLNRINWLTHSPSDRQRYAEPYPDVQWKDWGQKH